MDSDILPRRADYITHSLPSSKRERRPKPLERVVLSRSSVGLQTGNDANVKVTLTESKEIFACGMKAEWAGIF